MFEAKRIILQVEEDLSDHAHNLLFVVEVKDFRDVLNHVQLEVLELRQSKLVVAQDPEAAADVVGDLSISFAVVDQDVSQSVEASLLNELLCDLVDLEDVHK